MNRRLAVVLLLAVVALAGCARSGNPESFTDQPEPLPAGIEAFADEVGANDAGELPLVEVNFLEGCILAETPRIGDLSGAPLARACACSYDAITGFLLDNSVDADAAFQTFKDLNDDLKNEGSELSNQYRDLVAGCA